MERYINEAHAGTGIKGGKSYFARAGIFSGPKSSARITAIKEFLNSTSVTRAPLKGSGPAPGVLEISSRTNSVSALENCNPIFKTQINGEVVEQRNVEFIFDTEQNVFWLESKKIMLEILFILPIRSLQI